MFYSMNGEWNWRRLEVDGMLCASCEKYQFRLRSKPKWTERELKREWRECAHRAHVQNIIIFKTAKQVSSPGWTVNSNN